MMSKVLHNNTEATHISVEAATFYGVKQKPSRVLVNSQDAVFSYRDNQVRKVLCLFWQTFQMLKTAGKCDCLSALLKGEMFSSLQVLTVADLSLKLSQNFTISWM